MLKMVWPTFHASDIEIHILNYLGYSSDCNRSSENHHFWLDLILDHMVEVTLLDNLRRLPLLSVLSRYFLAPITARVRRKHAAYSRAKVQK